MGNNESHQTQIQQQQRLLALEKIVLKDGKLAQKQSIEVENLRHRVRALECRTEALEKIVLLLGGTVTGLVLLLLLNWWSHQK